MGLVDEEGDSVNTTRGFLVSLHVVWGVSHVDKVDRTLHVHYMFDTLLPSFPPSPPPSPPLLPLPSLPSLPSVICRPLMGVWLVP